MISAYVSLSHHTADGNESGCGLGMVVGGAVGWRGGFGLVGGKVGFEAGVEAAVDVGVALDDLDVEASFVEGDDFDEVGGFFEGAPVAPLVGAAGSGVVGGEDPLHLAVVAVEEVAEEIGSEFDVEVGGHEV